MERKTVLVTGAAVRLGREVALWLASRGYDVALHYHRSEAEARQTQQDVHAHGQRCEIFSCDLTQTAGLGKLLDSVFDIFPECDALVNSASVFDRMAFMETDEVFFDAQIAVNFKAPFFLTQGFAQRQPACHVVNIVDTAVAGNGISHFAYLLSKKALFEFTAMAARALAPQGRVNAVLPGTVLPSDKDTQEYIEKLRQTLPAGRLATPQEVAGAVYYLLENTSINGQSLFVDGGAHLL